MKLNAKMNATVVGKTTDLSKDEKTTYYRLLVVQDADCGKLGCPEEVFNSVEKNREYTFNMQYNDEYKSFRILGVVNDGIPSAATTPGGRPASTPASAPTK